MASSAAGRGNSFAGAAVLLACLAALALLPLGADKFYVQLVTKMMIMALFAMSLDLLIGYTGLVSFGHAAYFGVAGYVLAYAAPQYQAASLWVSLPLAMAVSALLALVIGLFVLRTSGVYFIMVTLAFAQMLYFVFHDTKLAGGTDGVYIYVRPDAALPAFLPGALGEWAGGWKPFDLENFVHFYYVVMGLLVLTWLLLRRVLASPFGRVIAGIKVNEPRMRSLGYATFRYKLVCFVIAGTLAGMAGYFAAAQFGFVNPDMLGWHLSGSAIMMVILGGMGSLSGAALGAFVMMLLELVFQGLTKHWQLLMGGTIVAVALLLPHGLLGTVTHWWAGRRRAQVPAHTPGRAVEQGQGSRAP
jgi:branched-chain amino acid transport system permease protein